MRKLRLAFVLFFIWVLLPTADVKASTFGPQDLDVIFVIDNSGSMNSADPRQIARTAVNLFIDSAEGSDSRIGFVFYSHTVEGTGRVRNFTDIISEVGRREIINAVNSVPRPTGTCDTDIALGIEAALDLFRDGRGTSTRTPAIILLSDGNTDLPRRSGRNTRTTEEAQAAILDVTQRAADNGIPIYTIGFNFDGRLDIGTMENIANTSGGQMHETSEAGELPLIMSDIYASLTGGSGRREIVIGTGFPQNFQFEIENSSIYRATLTIYPHSNNPVTDISLTDPNNSPGSHSLRQDPGGRYVIITLLNPIPGEWTLTFTGTQGDRIEIDLLSAYDLELVFDLPRTGSGSAEFAWRLEDSTGAAINDADLIRLLGPTIFITNIDTGNKTEHQFSPGQTSMSLPLDPGDYEAVLELNSGGIARTSNTHRFTVPSGTAPPSGGGTSGGGTSPPPPIPLPPTPLNDTQITLMTIFNRNSSIDMRGAGFAIENVIPLGEEWHEYAEFVYDELVNEINISALRSGYTEIRVEVEDTNGEKVYFTISVRILSGLIIIIPIPIVLIVILLIVVIFMSSKKPRLNDPMSKLYIKMTLPPDIDIETPPEDALVLPPVKGRKTLRDLLNMNVSLSEPYRIAFSQISWFADGTIFTARSKSQLEIKIPSNPGFTVKVDKLAGKNSVTFDRNGGTEIRIGYSGSSGFGDFEEYVILFGSAGSSGSGGNDYYDGSDGFDTTSPVPSPKNDDPFW
ncbi:MAG: VWA domain-containing protein [Clostridiales bacterium]|nr:VWA domain-containing protein [Clostridiales bacterium]